MIEPSRLLGFAFAGADLLFEIDADGRVLFAMGAARPFVGDAPMVGRASDEFFDASDGARFTALVRGLAPGGRIGPVSMAMRSGGNADLSLCYLPQNQDRISCTLVRPGSRTSLGSGVDAETGLNDEEAFIAAAVASAGSTGSLALVNVPKLPEFCAQLGTGEATDLLSRIGDQVRAIGAAASGRLSQTGFGVVTDDPFAAKGLARGIRSAIQEGGMGSLEVEEILVSLRGRDLTPEQTILALRHVIGRFAENKLRGPAPSNLADAFNTMLAEAFERAQAFHTTVAEGAFDLVFEPVTDLNTREISHYEALTRFAPGHSPAETIKFAEDMNMAGAFDLAVAVKIFAALEASSTAAPVALNISARSLDDAGNFAILAGLLTKKRALAKRVHVEITESVELADLAAANKRVQTLRAMGYRVGIDDFGAGAASFQYLHALSVDFVKVDGALIQRAGTSPREDAVLRGIASTCASLNIDTIAEWIDSAEILERCRDLGFKFGQGRFFGDARKTLPQAVAHAGYNARRKGTRVTRG